MKNIIAIFWKNAESMWDNWGLTVWGWIAIGVLIFIIIWFFRCKWKKFQSKKFDEQRKKINSLGYHDLDDIQIFLNRIEASLDDFISSKGIRKQYELFSEGKTSDFIKTAEQNKKLAETAASNHTAGLATGLAVGMVINNEK